VAKTSDGNRLRTPDMDNKGRLDDLLIRILKSSGDAFFVAQKKKHGTFVPCFAIPAGHEGKPKIVVFTVPDSRLSGRYRQ
jgi:hypothetical protein